MIQAIKRIAVCTAARSYGNTFVQPSDLATKHSDHRQVISPFGYEDKQPYSWNPNHLITGI